MAWVFRAALFAAALSVLALALWTGMQMEAIMHTHRSLQPAAPRGDGDDLRPASAEPAADPPPRSVADAQDAASPKQEGAPVLATTTQLHHNGRLAGNQVSTPRKNSVTSSSSADTDTDTSDRKTNTKLDGGEVVEDAPVPPSSSASSSSASSSSSTRWQQGLDAYRSRSLLKDKDFLAVEDSLFTEHIGPRGGPAQCIIPNVPLDTRWKFLGRTTKVWPKCKGSYRFSSVKDGMLKIRCPPDQVAEYRHLPVVLEKGDDSGWKAYTEGHEATVRGNIEARCRGADGQRTNTHVQFKAHAAGVDAARDIMHGYAQRHGEGARRPSLNVFLIDSLSRSMFIRSMPKAQAYLKHFNRDPKSAYRMFMFNKFHAVGHNSLPNQIAAFAGAHVKCPEPCSRKQRPKKCDHVPLVWKHLQKLGYMTGYINELYGPPHAGHWMCVSQKAMSEGLHHQYAAPWHLHPGTINKFNKQYFGKFPPKGPGHCYNGRYVYEYGLEYAEKFWRSYRTLPKWLLSVWYVAHTDDPSIVNYVDDPVVEHLKWILETDPNTVILFMADHGAKAGSYRNTEPGKLEARLPLLSMIVPKTLLAQQPALEKNLYMNQQRLVSPYDLYPTLLQVAEYPRQPWKPDEAERNAPPITMHSNCRSLFSLIAPRRGCRAANIPGEKCWCSTQMSKASQEELKKPAAAVLAYVNKFGHQLAAETCPELKIKHVTNGYVDKPAGDRGGGGTRGGATAKPRKDIYYHFTLATTHGPVYDASVQQHPKKGLLVATVTQTTTFAPQEACAEQAGAHGEFCYCNQEGFRNVN